MKKGHTHNDSRLKREDDSDCLFCVSPSMTTEVKMAAVRGGDGPDVSWPQM